MTHFSRVLLGFFSFLLVLGHAEILEIKEMKEILPHIDRDSLVIFDIDNTLIEPIQQLGSDQWFRHRFRIHKLDGHEHDLALEKALAEWMAVQCITDMQLVEADTSMIIHDLQKKNHTIIGLTTRSEGMAVRTFHQLQDVDINLSKTAPRSDDVIDYENGTNCHYEKGILFTANSDKGLALEKLLGHLKIIPKKVIFINDKYSHIIPVDKKCIERNIPFVGLRYSYLDDKVEAFDSDIADIQFQKFKAILSDDEAELLIAKSDKKFLDQE